MTNTDYCDDVMRTKSDMPERRSSLIARMCTLLILVFAVASAPARAQDADWETIARQYGVSELRAGVLLDGLEQAYPFPFLVREDSIDLGNWQNLSAEVLFSFPDDDMISWLGSPRIGIGGTLNFTGKISYARLAAVWHIPVFDTGFFIEPMVGGMIHDGYLYDAPAGQREMGCRVVYFYGGNIGYEVSEKLNVMATFEHGSHWSQCVRRENDGVNRMGIRLGWKLD